METVTITSTADAGLSTTKKHKIVGAELDHSSAANAQLRYNTSGGDVFVRLRTDATFPDRWWAPLDEGIPVAAVHVTLSAGSVDLYYEEQ